MDSSPARSGSPGPPVALSAAILVLDEVANLPACLATLRGAVDEAVVLDTGSSDGTVALLRELAADPAQQPPVRWAERPFDDFSRARSALHGLVRTPYLLWIDADERLTPGLAAELAGLRASGDLAAHDLWTVRRRNRVLGRMMRAGPLADQRVARVGRVAAVRLSGDAVHEGMVVAYPDGGAAREAISGAGAGAGRGAGAGAAALRHPLDHHALVAVGPYLRKIDLYTTLEAESGRSAYGRWQLLHLLVTGPATFWREWLRRGFWRDRWPGLVWAALAGWSATLRSWKAWRVGRRRGRRGCR